jgi:hypothetical protein
MVPISSRTRPAQIVFAESSGHLGRVVKPIVKKQYITKAPGWHVISGYFTQTDIQHMLRVSQGTIDLSNCASVLQNAQTIYQHISTHQMPQGRPWRPAWINNFFAWMNSNPTCPKPCRGCPSSSTGLELSPAPHSNLSLISAPPPSSDDEEILRCMMVSTKA